MDDAELLLRTREDPEAFAAFYRRWERPVLAYFARRVGAIVNESAVPADG